MNVTIGNEFERRISEKVDTGLYTSASEVIRDGLRLLFEKDVIRERQAELLKQELEKGIIALDRGEVSNKSVMDIMEEVKAEHAKQE